MWEKTNLCIPVCLYSISVQHIDFFDFQTNRSLQRMKIELRLHQESCFQVELEVLLMELLAYRIYLSIKECIKFYGFETSSYGGVRDSLPSRALHRTPLLGVTWYQGHVLFASGALKVKRWRLVLTFVRFLTTSPSMLSMGWKMHKNM